MTDREEIILDTMLEALAPAASPLTEAWLHGLVTTKLGTPIAVAEFSAVMQLAQQRSLATGLAGLRGKTRWSLTETGRHYIANK
jgi:hypothetical protein